MDIFKLVWAMGLFNAVIGQEDSYQVFLSQTEAYDVSRGSVLGYYDIVDEMHFELDITLNSWNTGSGWNNVIHGSPNDANCCNIGDRMPGIWLTNSGSTSSGFYMMFDNTQKGDPVFWTNTPVSPGNTYHVTMDITQSWLTVTVDGVTIKDESKPSHPTYTNVKMYASDSYYNSADVTISNFIIANMAAPPPTEEPSKDPSATPTVSPSAEPTADPARDCDVLHIDEFLVDCSVEFEGHDNDIDSLKSDVTTIKDDVASGEASIVALEGTVDNLVNSTSVMDAAIQELEYILSQAKAGHDALEAVVNELVNSSSAADESIDEIKADIQTIMEQLEKIGDLPAAASVIGGNMDWYQQSAGDSMVQWNGTNMMIAGLVIANVVTMIVLAVVCCGDGSSNKHRYGAVGVASDSELVNMK